MLVLNDISAGKTYTYGTGIYLQMSYGKLPFFWDIFIYKCLMGNFSSSEASAWYQQEQLKPHQDTLVRTDRNNNEIRAEFLRNRVLENSSKHQLDQPPQRQEQHHWKRYLSNPFLKTWKKEMLKKMQLDENQLEINSLISSDLNSVGSKEQLIIILSLPASYLLRTFISSSHRIFQC